jgi:peptidoglycan/xylan/chitin deacetylase (PgdA/CDA1 family)
MNIFKKAYYTTCSILPMALVKKLGPSTTLFPYQHTVSNEQLLHIKHLYDYKNEKQFTADLECLLKHYKPVSVDDITRSLEKGSLPKNSFLLSFDDGFREVHDVIAPILERKGIPACFFINPAFIDNKELFYRCKISLLINELLKHEHNNSFLNVFNTTTGHQSKSIRDCIAYLKTTRTSNAYLLDEIANKINFSFTEFLQTQQPFLTNEQLKSLHQRGFHIGAHSINHPYFQDITIEEQIKQVIVSCQYVNDLLGTDNCCFSFPHSDKGLSQQLFDQLTHSSISLLFGIQNQKMELQNKMLHRFNSERPEINFTTQLKGMLVMLWIQHITSRNKINRN